MPSLGTNIRSTAPASARDAVRTFYTDAFGCERITPMDDVDIFAFDAGFSIGVYFVADGDALSRQQQRDVGTWIEIRVDDVPATRRKVIAAGGEPFEYFDKEHEYFHAPGGQVFRLAPH
jgi:predicted enzyme related to lactoylglutathione lyase